MVTVSSPTSPRTIDEVTLRAFRARLQGDLLAPGDPGYDDTRRVFNAMIDRYPALIARARSAEDVRRAVLFAREHDLPFRSRAAATTSPAAPCATADSCWTCRCSRESRSIRSDGSPWRSQDLSLGEVDAATQEFGLATPLGTASITGHRRAHPRRRHRLAQRQARARVRQRRRRRCRHRRRRTAAGERDRECGPLLGHPRRERQFRRRNVLRVRVASCRSGPDRFPGATPPRSLETRFASTTSSARSCPDELSTLGNLATDDDGRTVMSITYSWCGPLDEGERALRPLRSFGTPIEDAVEVHGRTASCRQVIDERFPAGPTALLEIELPDGSQRRGDRRLDALRGGAALASARPRRDGAQPRLHRPAARPWRCSPGRPDRDGVSASPRPPRFPASSHSGPIPPTRSVTSPGRASSLRQCVRSPSAPFTSMVSAWKERSVYARRMGRTTSGWRRSRHATIQESLSREPEHPTLGGCR